MLHQSALKAVRARVRGIVQGVGFRPFVYRLAHQHELTGWVLNGENGVELHVEGDERAIEDFMRDLTVCAPSAARIDAIEHGEEPALGFETFEIRESERHGAPTVRISPDLPVCDDCLTELFDARDRRAGYPFINCTNCGPRYSIIEALPYDRPNTTMREWPLCAQCAAQYRDPLDRRFHAQPVACAACGPAYVLHCDTDVVRGSDALRRSVELLIRGAVLAVKGIGGYHLACDAANPAAVRALRERKYRKERPFALMVRDIETAREVIEITPEIEALLIAVHRPIVLARAKRLFDGVAPDNRDLGVMLAYTPLHHLLFAAGAPRVLVMTSGNRSSEPIAYEDSDAFERLSEIADAMLVGERRIARRIDDSIVRVGPNGPVVLRHARGYAPRAVAALPCTRPILALGADLKNSMVLVVDGQAFASQHIGDLEDYGVFTSFTSTVRDLCHMYGVTSEEVIVAHDMHPEYRSTAHAQSLESTRVAVQHHRAHVASVLAERGAFDEPVIGLAFDGTGYGDDGSIWGGEVFTGTLRSGFQRRASLFPAKLPGGDAAARYPVVAAAGFLDSLEEPPDVIAAPFAFPHEYSKARQLIERNVRIFTTTSVGRLFDTVAALLGFTRPISFEGQAAMWLEHLAAGTSRARQYDLPVSASTIDYRPLLQAVLDDRRRGRDIAEIARGFHEALARACAEICEAIDPSLCVAASGGVFQNALLLEMLAGRLGNRLWLNAKVPPNDGGIALGQAAIAAVSVCREGVEPLR